MSDVDYRAEFAGRLEPVTSDITATERLFAARLQRLRRAKNLTSRELSARAGVTEHVVYQIEAALRGAKRSRRTTIGEAVALAKALGVDLAHLIDPHVTHVTVPLGGGDR
jgi:transcriptional regulator with XRE-family HTH domain